MTGLLSKLMRSIAGVTYFSLGLPSSLLCLPNNDDKPQLIRLKFYQ